MKKFLLMLMYIFMVGIFVTSNAYAKDNYLVDVIIVGPGGCGKTVLRNALCNRDIEEAVKNFSIRKPTKATEVGLCSEPFEIGDKSYVFIYWDTPGDKYVQDNILKDCVKLGKLFMVVMDLGDPSLTFEEFNDKYIKMIKTKFEKEGAPRPPIVLIGSKSDTVETDTKNRFRAYFKDKCDEVYIVSARNQIANYCKENLPKIYAQHCQHWGKMMPELTKKINIRNSLKGESIDIVDKTIEDSTMNPDEFSMIESGLKKFINRGRVFNLDTIEDEKFKKKMITYKQRKRCNIL